MGLKTGTLEQLGDKGALRTKAVRGQFEEWPQVGQSFMMMAPPLEKGNFRLVTTSRVVSMEPISNGWRFKTESGSLYEVWTDEV